MQRPPPFIPILENVYIQRRSGAKLQQEEADVCQCRVEEGRGCTESCLNRSLFTECVLGTCPCGSACRNQRLQNRQWAKTSLRYFGEKGWGVLAEEPLTAGQLVVEYIGEVCDLKEVERRARHYENLGLRNTYIMNLNSSEVIDATRMGNYSRFINHSCSPNAECQKWTVNGEQRIAIFASTDISVGEEITYNYNLDWNGGRRVKCQCGSMNCSGYLGAESVLWRKTVHTPAKKRSLFSECVTESLDHSYEGLSSSGSCMEGTLHEANGVILPIRQIALPRWDMLTRSKILSEKEGSPICENPVRHKRRKLEPVDGEMVPSSTPSTPASAEHPLSDSHKPVPSFRAKKMYPLFVMRPVPQRFTFLEPPTVSRTLTGFHPSFLSVTDTIPLTELIGDPFLIWNQEYYITMADLPLNGLTLNQERHRMESAVGV